MNDDPLLPDEALSRIDSLVAAVDRAEAAGIECTDAIHIHFLRNFTVEPIEPYLKFHVLRDAIRPTISYGGFDTLMQEALDSESELRTAAPDIVVLAIELTMLDPKYTEPDWSADHAIERLEQIYDTVRDNTSAVCIANTMIAPLYAESESAPVQHGTDSEIARINAWIWQYAEAGAGRIVAVDWDHLLDYAGTDNAIDNRYWRMSMAPFKGGFLDLYSREITKVVRALMGRAKKCLVLDCDDTLWGGVIGEDGIDNIRLDPDEESGRGYYEFQRNVLALHDRGVLIALCSKNNVEDIWEVMERKPHCLLKKEHLAAWRINWEDKASNIAALADEMNLALDSFVFVDDSPRECELIRTALPQVAVLQVPENLGDYPRLLVDDGLFDTISVSIEDRQRATMYRDEARRSKGRQLQVSLDDYLASLEQTLRVWEATGEDRARVAQLAQRTNQFNLTTRRHSEGQIDAFMNDDNAAVYVMSVTDRYGDMGTTGVLIAQRDDQIARIDSLLLSCRVLGRKLEFAFVDTCLHRLEQRWSITAWEAEFLATRKNTQVADFWDRVGFSLREESASIKSYSSGAGRRSNGYKRIMLIEEAGIDA